MTLPLGSKVKAIFLLSVLGGSLGFAPPTQHTFWKGSSLRSYLDSLSPEQPDEPEKKKVDPSPKKKRSGGIPSGRGPEESYLDAMTGEGGTEDGTDTDDQEDEDPMASSPSTKKPAGWSGGYLNNFLSGEDDSRTDIRNLLTQRSIQSFMYLCEQCRDPHSAKWIQEDFLETGNLLDYHGTGAGFIERFGGLWDAPLLAMIKKPKDQLIISAKRRGRGHGGWSKNNPFLKERWMEIPVDIDPPNLASRILSVREQIAKEWVQDLNVVLVANNEILDSYFAKIRSGREERTLSGEAVGRMDIAFDRTAVNMMNDNSRFSVTASSPFRRSNFDLLYNLCTQAAIHRILRERKAGGNERDVFFAFLLDFYTDRAAEYFDGDLPYGRADDFIDELLQTPPAVLLGKNGKKGLIDPLGTAEEIIRVRNDVAEEWRELMGRVQEDHTGIRQALLSNQMTSWDSGAPDESADNRDDEAFQ